MEKEWQVYAGTLAPETLVVTGTVSSAGAVLPIGVSLTVMSFATPVAGTPAASNVVKPFGTVTDQAAVGRRRGAGKPKA